MNWQPKTLATIITGLISLLYFNVIFCEEAYSKGSHTQSDIKIVDMLLTFSSPSPVITAAQSIQSEAVNAPIQSIIEPLETEATEKLIRKKKLVKQLAILPNKNETLLNKENIEAVTSNSTKSNQSKKNRVETKKNSLSAVTNMAKKSQQSQSVSHIIRKENNRQEVEEISAMQSYMGQVRDFIARQKRYPKEAKLRRHQGKVTISFIINANGFVSQSKIIKSCSSRYINKSVKVLLSKLRFKVAPEAIKNQFPKTVILDVNYQFS